MYRKELGLESTEISEDELLATAVESLDKRRLEELISKVGRITATTTRHEEFGELLRRIVKKGKELRMSAEK